MSVTVESLSRGESPSTFMRRRLQATVKIESPRSCRAPRPASRGKTRSKIDPSKELTEFRARPDVRGVTGIDRRTVERSVNVRTPSASSARVTAFISSSVLVSGDSMILFSTPVRLRMPVAAAAAARPRSTPVQRQAGASGEAGEAQRARHLEQPPLGAEEERPRVERLEARSGCCAIVHQRIDADVDSNPSAAGCRQSNVRGRSGPAL